MADQCIVCLEDLDAVPDASIHDDLPVVAVTTEDHQQSTHPSTTTTSEPIALIKPCNHVLHDECLRAWSQKANSCPICRQTFNLVEVLDKVGGTVLSEYAVEDKKQVAEFDPNAWVEDQFEEEEESRPCPVCGEADQEEVLLLCDSCDAPYHTHCIGLGDRVPHGHWFCMECADEGAYARAAGATQDQTRNEPISGRRGPRTQAGVRRSRQRLRNDHWVGAWSLFSSRIHNVAGLDLDFSDDDLSMADYRRHQRRTSDERREFQRWQQRLNIAGRQGAREVFRAAAPVRIRSPTPAETIEETRAWGAFEKAKEMDTKSPRSRKRKSRSVTASPAEGPSAPPAEPERKLKRPRTRRVLNQPEASSSSAAGSSRQMNGQRAESPTARILNDTTGEPSFLSSLLKEVEMNPTSDDDRSAFSATTTSGPNRVTSPSVDYSSPAASPVSSSPYHTPRASSMTPPPHISKRSGSPLPLTSRVEPIFPPAEYSPNRSPPESKSEQEQISPITELRQPRPRRQKPVTLPRSQETSPTRAVLPIEAKEGINKIVKSALAPHWKSMEITKEQYAEINRDVSRKLYETINFRNLNDEKEKWACEKIATAEVATAVKALTA
ncbi:uncharacterized protein LY89DRAFT_494158 [Mollisia scopiformis]|uniref:PHD and RING finger domain-containing protein n=1 Tax=Mollisia scopiformis TaxID=149040 RepID=A0A194XHC3_MOLSC|nr:uncharacterized protein LY89DRAFT_494158 [Mollisia scopiformis]KUJ19563.1 hypothetical protein LY89DRAFT_494158 [Mollisia scopiformis]